MHWARNISLVLVIHHNTEKVQKKSITHVDYNVWFQENSILAPHGRSLEIPRGRGGLKAKFVEEMYENKLEFPGGRCKTKNLPWGEYGYFLELNNAINTMN